MMSCQPDLQSFHRGYPTILPLLSQNPGFLTLTEKFRLRKKRAVEHSAAPPEMADPEFPVVPVMDTVVVPEPSLPLMVVEAGPFCSA